MNINNANNSTINIFILFLVFYTLILSNASQSAIIVGGGDIDNNGVVNVGDKILIERYLLGDLSLTIDQLSKANVAPLGNPDEGVNLGDMLLIDQVLLGQLTTNDFTKPPAAPVFTLFDQYVEGAQTTINGTTIPNMEVRLYVDGILIDTAVSNSAGEFSFVVPLQIGANTVVVKAWDGFHESIAEPPSVVVSASASIDPPAPSETGNTDWGVLRGNHHVGLDGSFSYTIPIDVVAGINGIQPDISLAYNSNTRNGWLGWGWSIQGIPSITICPANLARDGIVSGVQDYEIPFFRFCLNGKRLIEVSQDEFRTEDESFARITRTVGSGTFFYPESWQVILKNGDVLEYGANNGVNNSIFYQVTVFGLPGQAGFAQPAEWFLSRKKDIAGNYVDYFYERPDVSLLTTVPFYPGLNDPSHRIEHIEYTKNDSAQSTSQRIEFEYEPRNDDFNQFVAGQEKIIHERLSTVTVKSNGQPVYIYNVDYQQAGSSYFGKLNDDPQDISRIASIEKCYENTSQCSKPLQFEWTFSGPVTPYTSDQEFAVSATAQFYQLLLNLSSTGQSESPTIYYADPRVSADFTGDGVLDHLIVSGKSFLLDDRRNENPLNVWGSQLSLVEGDLSVTPSELNITPITTIEPSINHTVTASSGNNQTYVSDRFFQIIDINHDGRMDLIYMDTHILRGIKVFISDGTSLSLSGTYSVDEAEMTCTSQWVSPYGITNTGSVCYRVEISDFNGDGLVDILRYPSYIWDHTQIVFWNSDISIALNNGTGFDPFVQWADANDTGMGAIAENPTPFFRDVTGDGLPDIVGTTVVNHDGFAASHFAGVAVNRPVGTDNPSHGSFTVFYDWGANSFFNNIGSINVFNNGATTDWSMSQLVANRYTNLGDMNGDGLADLVRFKRSGLVFVNYATGDGFGELLYWGQVNLNGEPDVEKDIAPNYYVVGSDVRRCCRFNLVDYDLDGRDDLMIQRDNIFGFNQSAWAYEESVMLTRNYAFAQEAVSQPLLTGWSLASRLGDHNQNGFPTTFESDVSNAELNQIIGVYEAGFNSLSVNYKPFAQQKIYSPLEVGIEEERMDNFILSGSIGNQAAGLSASSITLGHIANDSLYARYGVASVIENDYVGGEIDTNYHYTGAKRHLSGFGSLGFESFEETMVKLDEIGNPKALVTTSNYLQAVDEQNRYVLAGRLKERTVEIDTVTDNTVAPPVTAGSPQLLSKTRMQWKVRDYASDYDTDFFGTTYVSPHYFAYQYTTSNERYDLNGTQINESSTFNRGGFLFPGACGPLLEAEVNTVLESIAGDANDIDYSLNGTLAGVCTNTCDNLSVGQNYRAKKRLNLSLVDAGNRLDLPTKIIDVGLVGNVGVGLTSVPRTTALEYYSTTEVNTGYAGQLKSYTTEPDSSDADIKITTEFEYDVYGLKKSITKSWSNNLNNGLDFSNRVMNIANTFATNSELTSVVTYPVSSHVETTVFDAQFGLPKSFTDRNGLLTSTQYDAAGRPELINYFDGTNTAYQYLACGNASCFAHSDYETWFEVAKTTGASVNKTYYDTLHRTVGAISKSLNGADVFTAQTYDGFGRNASSSDPFFVGGAQHNTTATFDILDRARETVFPAANGATNTQTQSYNGLQTTIINREGQQNIQWANSVGWLMQSIDATGTTVDFSYDNYGGLSSTIVDGNSATAVSIEYDVLGRRTSLNDPDLGQRIYTYNPLGLLSTETDAKGQEVRYSYDALERQVGREDVGVGSNALTLSHQWEYDTAQGKGIGKLAEVEGQNTDGSTYSEAYSYSDTGLPVSIQRTLLGNTYKTINLFDSFSRPVGTIYPSGYVKLSTYNSSGFVDVVENGDGAELWLANSMDARGNLTQFTQGNGTATNSTFDPFTGRVASINAAIGATTIQNQVYSFSALGNLTSRTDNRAGITQSFCYDNLNRLTASRFDGCSSGDTDFTYSPLGNILTKAGVAGSYAYGANGAGVHAVTSTGSGATLANYVYDDNGDLISKTSNGVTATLAYSLFGKPIYMGSPTDNTAIIYNPNKKRISRIDSDGRNTVYVGSNYEVTSKNGLIEATHYIDDFAYYIERSDNNNELIYLHRDHLGSLVAKSDATVASMADVQLMANGPWGLRKVDQWDGIDSDGGLESEGATRGFTDHEHLDAVGLIHMNGRVYDPAIGRFVSADPFVQSPENTQSYNRYSYVMNNPLSYTDPSGFAINEVRVSARRQASPQIVGGLALLTGRAALAGLNKLGQKLLSGIVGAVAGVAVVENSEKEDGSGSNEDPDDSSELSDNDASEDNNEETLLDFLKNSLSETAGGGPSGNEQNNEGGKKARDSSKNEPHVKGDQRAHNSKLQKAKDKLVDHRANNRGQKGFGKTEKELNTKVRNIEREVERGHHSQRTKKQ